LLFHQIAPLGDKQSLDRSDLHQDLFPPNLLRKHYPDLPLP
jgi:hemolysin-activating ACP:hemolysin acyltransferase